MRAALLIYSAPQSSTSSSLATASEQQQGWESATARPRARTWLWLCHAQAGASPALWPPHTGCGGAGRLLPKVIAWQQSFICK